MIKAIIFDFGNVICHFDNNLFINKISKYTNKSVEEITNLIYKIPELPDLYESGAISSEEFFEKICKLCNLKEISKEEFIESYTNIFTPITPTFNLINKLKENYKLGLISNISKWNFEFGFNKYEISPMFQAITLSFEVGAMKPDSRIFEDSLKNLNLNPDECVYIDDIKEYSDKARELGMLGINYTSHTELLKKLKAFGVKV